MKSESGCPWKGGLTGGHKGNFWGGWGITMDCLVQNGRYMGVENCQNHQIEELRSFHFIIHKTCHFYVKMYGHT